MLLSHSKRFMRKRELQARRGAESSMVFGGKLLPFVAETPLAFAVNARWRGPVISNKYRYYCPQKGASQLATRVQRSKAWPHKMTCAAAFITPKASNREKSNRGMRVKAIMPRKGAICSKYLSYSGTFPPTPNCSTIKKATVNKAKIAGGQDSTVWRFCQTSRPITMAL